MKVVCLIGNSGAGKSAVRKILEGRKYPAFGFINVDGELTESTRSQHSTRGLKWAAENVCDLDEIILQTHFGQILRDRQSEGFDYLLIDVGCGFLKPLYPSLQDLTLIHLIRDPADSLEAKRLQKASGSSTSEKNPYEGVTVEWFTKDENCPYRKSLYSMATSIRCDEKSIEDIAAEVMKKVLP